MPNASLQVRPTDSPNLFEIQSESNPEHWYSVFVSGDEMKCSCKGFLSHRHCKHMRALAEYLHREDHHGDMRATEPDGYPSATITIPSIPKEFVVELHGKQFVQYAGLLAMAHEQGLQSLTARLTSVSNTIALAEATATFKDGGQFTECGDATPANVNERIKPHYPRMALTRAKARALRDALNIGMAAIEEIE